MSPSKNTERSLDMVSYQTILCPQDSIMSSEILTEMGDLMRRMDTEWWHHKIHFFITTLTFCLGLSNIWMFPKHALIHGNATYVYLYILYTLSFGSSLLFFEVCLGQYTANGFAKTFSLCPLFEGVSFSMTFYCLIASMYYNILNVYTIYYLFVSLYRKMPHSVPQSNNYRNNSKKSTEYEYFQNEVLIDPEHHSSSLNYQNCGILLIIWGMIFIVLFLVSRRVVWVPLIVSVAIILTVTYAMVMSLTLEGAHLGVEAMFWPIRNDLSEIKTWINPLEQSLVTMGLGIGPLIHFGSYAKFRSSTHFSCIFITLTSLTISLLSGVMFFAIAGSLAYDKNTTIDELFNANRPYEDFQMHVICSEFMNKLTHNWSQFTSMAYFLMVLLDGFYSVAIYTTVAVLWTKSFIPTSHKKRIYLVLGICVICYFMGCIATCHKESPQILAAIDKIFIGNSILMVIFAEMFGVCYFYGLENYCDDIEFMLGYIPNYLYQISWLISPFFILLMFGMSMSLIMQSTARNWYDYSAIILMVTFTLLPMISVSLYNCYHAVFKLKHFSAILHPREIANDVISERSTELYEIHNSTT